MVPINLAIRFIVELVAVGIFGYWAWTVAGPGLPGWVAAGIAIAVFVTVWGLFLAPTAERGLSRTQKDVLGTAGLLIAAVALAVIGETTAAAIYAVVVLVNIGLLYVLRDEVARVLGNAGRR